MSAVLLGTMRACRFDVVGQRDEQSGVIPHVGLLRDSTELWSGREVEVLDMSSRPRLDPPGRFKVAVAGTLELTRDEQDGIEEWLAELLPRVSICTYVALPAARRHRDPVSGQISRWEFSCAGLVDSAYQAAGIHLVDQDDLPALERKDAVVIWAGGRENLFDRLAAGFGLDGAGPWSVLLPGHILHALSLGRAALPYRPSAVDRLFP
ncbi:MAG: hypothetical protein JNL82_27865 [Myxococcales bacterium]|nr:hypothetical protein [Myxococcales bacterium]